MSPARMLGAVAPDWCPICHSPAGLDCPSRGRSKREVKAREKRQVRREIEAESRDAR